MSKQHVPAGSQAGDALAVRAAAASSGRHLRRLPRLGRVHFALAALLLIATVGTAFAQRNTTTLAGRIVDRETRAPIVGAWLAIEGLNRGQRTDDSGRFAFPGLPSGPHRLRAVAIGYNLAKWLLRVEPGGLTHETLEMTPRPVVLDSLQVQTTEDTDWRSPDALARRRSRSVGHFLMREDIDSRQAVTMGDLLQAVPGIVTMCQTGECRTVITRSGRGCTPEWYVDGFPASFAGGPEFPSRFTEAVEVYLNAGDAPLEMQRPGQRCGVIAIWTRRRQ